MESLILIWVLLFVLFCGISDLFLILNFPAYQNFFLGFYLLNNSLSITNFPLKEHFSGFLQSRYKVLTGFFLQQTSTSHFYRIVNAWGDLCCPSCSISITFWNVERAIYAIPTQFDVWSSNSILLKRRTKPYGW